MANDTPQEREISVTVEAGAWIDKLGSPEKIVIAAATAALNADDEVGVLLTDDTRVQALNLQFRGIDKPTNVLSFEDDEPTAYRGDIAVAFETVAREAAEEGKTLSDHLSHLIVHGCLHLLGEDHEEATDADRMEAREIAILAKLDIANPYEAELADHA